MIKPNFIIIEDKTSEIEDTEFSNMEDAIKFAKEMSLENRENYEVYERVCITYAPEKVEVDYVETRILPIKKGK